MNTYIKIVFSLMVCLGWSSLSYTQDCLPQANSGNDEVVIGRVIVSYGATTNAVTTKVAANVLVGQPLVGQSNTREIVADYGFYTQFLLPPLPPTVTASQGELLDRIKVSWAIDPLGSAPNEGFNIYRDSVFIESVGPKVRNYNDFNVIAGVAYNYEVSGINNFGEGSRGEGLGFQVPNGVVTGWVRTLNERPVPDALIALMPMQGFSAKFDATDGAVAIQDNNHPFLPSGGDWTMTLWMKTTSSSAGADILNFNGSTFKISDNGSGIDITQGTNGLEADFANDEWHHVALSYSMTEGTSRLYLDGVLKEQSTMNSIASPDSIYFGLSNWSGIIDEYRIYHTLLDELDFGMIMEGTASSDTPFLSHYWKFDEELGEKSFDIVNRHKLFFCGAHFDADRPPVRTAGVTNEDGYYRIEGASYGTGTTFLAEPAKNFYLRRSLEFKSSESDYVSLPEFAIPPQSTIELWINNTNAGGIQTILSNGDVANTFNIFSELSGANNQLKVGINGDNQSFGNLQTGFNHIAFTIDNLTGLITGYINGILTTTNTYSFPSNWSDISYQWTVGTDNNISNFFNGLIDDLAVYNALLNPSAIQAHAQMARDMAEEGLIVYFPMDEGNGIRVSNTGSTLLVFGTINGATWSNFAANQETTPHKFSPKTRQVTLNPSVTSVDQVDFTDLSTIPVSGYVRFLGTKCFQPRVEILVNGASFSPPIFTDSLGKFLVDFDPGFTGILTPKFEDHTYSPASWEVINVTSPIAGILFNNTVKRKISGQVAGGLCKLPILENVGQSQGTICKVKVSTSDGCLERIITLDDENGDFEFDNLPPLENIVLAVIEHSDPNIKTFFEVSGGSQLDISLKDTIKNMIYFAPPQIEIVSGLEPISAECDKIVIVEGTSKSLVIRMKEIYLGEECFIDTADVRIINGFSDETRDTSIMNGSLIYEFVAGDPNPSPPYLKTFQVIGTSLAGRESSFTKQGIVTGIKQKKNTFVTTLPETPSLILRDPPGDGSYSYFEKDSTFCKTVSISSETSLGIGIQVIIDIGPDVEYTDPLGFTWEVESTIGPDITLLGTVRKQGESALEYCTTTSKRISTSSDDLIVGSQGGDVIMGHAMNLVFGFADVVVFDESTCTASDTTNIFVSPGGFATSFIYSEFYIENTLLVYLEELKQDAINNGSTEDITKYNNSILSWEKILKDNDKFKEEAIFVENVSFDAGSEYEYSITSDTTESGSSMSESILNIDGEFSLLAEVIGIGGGVVLKANFESIDGSAVDSTTSKGITTGYVLSDDDVLDAFSVDIAIDTMFKTPVFKIKAGQSSCPWEEGTANREAPNLQLAPGSEFVEVNVPANEPAVFQFQLGNLSATNEDWTYSFGAVPANNPLGAVIKMNGQTLNGGSVDYIIPYGTSQLVTVTVEKGPIEYDYDSLLVALYSGCEYDRNFALSIPIDNDPNFFSPIYIGAHFIRPCSEVNINVPQQNWVIHNSVNTPDIMNITVSGYNLKEPDFQLIRLQYRKENGDGAWINIPGISDRYNYNWKDYDAEPNVLGEIFTQYSWDTNGLVDGNYEIRAVAICTGDASDKPGFSQIIKGKIDRQPPSILGVPQPSDGVYHVGDEISFTFNQDINCNKLIQAEITQANNVGLYDAEAVPNVLIDANITCKDNKIIIDPNFQNEFFENRILRAELDEIQDLVGNTTGNLIWEFYVDRNELAWLTDSIELTKYDDETKTITAKIHNRGGYPVPYTMQSVPDWVHVSPNAGTLVANEIEEIHFTVDETVPLGWFSDSIIMHTETGLNPFFMGGDEVLNMAARVICRPDEWIINPQGFDPSGFSYSMNYTLALNIEGVVSDDEQDLVGAYVNGQLRGVARLQYNPELDNYLAFLTAYSNVASGETVEFQIWDASECKLFALILESFTFQADQIIGSPLTPQMIHTDSKVLRKIFIHPGWIWMSMNVNLVDPATNGALSSLTNPGGGLIKTQGPFSNYSLIQQLWIGTLDTLSPIQMYQYNSLAFDSLSIVGTLLDPATQIPLVSGWNWIGYIPNEKLSITEALSSLTPTDGDIIKSQISFAQYVQNYGWIGNLNFLDAPNGYLLNVANPDVLVYPDPQNVRGHNASGNRLTPPIGNGVTLVDKEEEVSKLSDYWEVDASQYEHNMNVIAIVKTHEGNGNILRDGDEVAAFVGEEVRGSNLVTYIPSLDAYMIFMTVYANKEGELLTFKFYDSSVGQVHDIEESTGFVINSVLGEVDNPEPLHLAMPTGLSYEAGISGNISTYPNPFTSSVFVKFYGSSSKDDQLVITDGLSRIVETIDVRIKPGENVMEWRPATGILPGAYYINLKGNEASQVQKVLYIK